MKDNCQMLGRELVTSLDTNGRKEEGSSLLLLEFTDSGDFGQFEKPSTMSYIILSSLPSKKWSANGIANWRGIVL